MAVVLIDGFDYYTSAQSLLAGWGTALNTFVAGRFGGNAAQRTGNATSAKSLPASYSTLICGFAYQAGSVTSTSADIFALMAGATAAVRIQLVAGGGSQQLRVVNSAGTVIATGTTNILANVWHYVELKAVIAGAAGSCELHLDGIAGEIASTTGNFGSTNLDGIRVQGGVTGSYDDIYALDTTGLAPNNTFLGDVRITPLFPSSDGAHAQWTPSSGTAHWSLVDDASPNDDTDYVSDATVGDIDTFGCTDVDGGATVYAVQQAVYARKDDANARQIAPVIRQSGTDYVGTTVTLASTYQYFRQLYDKDPTGAAWAATNVNADEFGVKTIA